MQGNGNSTAVWACVQQGKQRYCVGMCTTVESTLLCGHVYNSGNNTAVWACVQQGKQRYCVGICTTVETTLLCRYVYNIPRMTVEM